MREEVKGQGGDKKTDSAIRERDGGKLQIKERKTQSL